MSEAIKELTQNYYHLTGFLWTQDREKAALLMAQGYPLSKIAVQCGICQKTLYNWRQHPEFAAEVDRLSLMVGVASRAERLRIAAQVIRQKCKEESIETNRDLLDWLKYAQGETDGIKLDLTPLLEATLPMAGSGPERVAGPPAGAIEAPEPEP